MKFDFVIRAKRYFFQNCTKKECNSIAGLYVDENMATAGGVLKTQRRFK